MLRNCLAIISLSLLFSASSYGQSFKINAGGPVAEAIQEKLQYNLDDNSENTIQVLFKKESAQGHYVLAFRGFIIFKGNKHILESKSYAVPRGHAVTGPYIKSAANQYVMDVINPQIDALMPKKPAPKAKKNTPKKPIISPSDHPWIRETKNSKFNMSDEKTVGEYLAGEIVNARWEVLDVQFIKVTGQSVVFGLIRSKEAGDFKPVPITLILQRDQYKRYSSVRITDIYELKVFNQTWNMFQTPQYLAELKRLVDSGEMDRLWGK